MLAGFNRGQGTPGRAWGKKKNGPQAIGKTRGGWNTKIHALTVSDTCMAGFLLTPGNEADAQAGRLLLDTLDPRETTVTLLMDRAYEDNKTRFTAWMLRYSPVVPAKKNRVKPWDYDHELYKQRNEVERFFRRLKRFRGIFTRYETLDRMFSAFIWLACICILLRSVNTP
jgi:transposase